MVGRGFLAEIQRQSRAAAADAARQERAAVKEHQAASRRAEQARKADERQRAQAARALEADRKQAEKAAAEAHLAAMLAEVDDLNRGLAETYDEIDSLLTATLSVDDHVDLESLRREVEHPAFDRADLEQAIPMPVMIPEPAEPVLEIPPPPGGFFRRKQRHAALLAAAESAYRTPTRNGNGRRNPWRPSGRAPQPNISGPSLNASRCSVRNEPGTSPNVINVKRRSRNTIWRSTR